MLMGGVCFEPVTFTASDSLQQWKIPAGVRKIHVDCVAAAGATSASNYAGGKGGRVQCDLKVSAGQILYIMAGKKPSDGQLEFITPRIFASAARNIPIALLLREAAVVPLTATAEIPEVALRAVMAAA